MAVVNFLVSMKRNELDARVHLGILEQDLTVLAGQFVVRQVKGLQTVTLGV